jgi:hypothetical protein
MAETKPSGIPIVEGPNAIVTQEVSHIDKKGCLNLLPRWTEKLEWFPSPVTEVFDALMVFLEPGYLSIRNLRADEIRIREKYEAIARDDDTEALEFLRRIQDRYGRLRIPASRRPSLGDTALTHLRVKRGEKTTIYVAIFPHSIEILSVECRDQRLLAITDELNDLPFE